MFPWSKVIKTDNDIWVDLVDIGIGTLVLAPRMTLLSERVIIRPMALTEKNNDNDNNIAIVQNKWGKSRSHFF